MVNVQKRTKEKRVYRKIESGRQKAIIQYFKLMKCFVIRINSGAMENNGRYFRAYYIDGLGSAGCSDLIVGRKGYTVFVETKSETGKQSPKQKEFELYLKKYELNYEICRNVQDAEMIYKKYFKNL